MAKKPKNDNLVMESIEDLFNQADSISETEKNRVKREQAKSLPIIGAQPVSVENNAPETAEPLVLAGQKRPLSEQTAALFPLEPPLMDAAISGTQNLDNKDSDAGSLESENPFLAIRQAVISAGEPTPSDAELKTDNAEINTPKIPEKGQKSGAHAKLKGQNFTDQIAQLIDNEIEMRLKAQLSIIALANHPAKALTTAEEDRKKGVPARKSKKSSAKTAQKKPATKKLETKKLAAKNQKKAEPKKTALKKIEAKPVAKTAAKKAVVKKQPSAKKLSRKRGSAKGAARPKKKS
ncbi:MAG: hypothetical protein L7W39_05545 [Alphaproteobacteria bacterium]|nr:hypothetical protein [Alphaproteobacteria bacterium]